MSLYPRMATNLSRCAGLMAGLLCVLGAGFGPALGAEGERAAERIQAALAKPTTFEFHETPFKDAVDFLRQLHGIHIEFSSKALEEAGISTEAPIRRTLKDIPLRSALNLLLSELGASYSVENDVLLITSAEDARRRSSPAVYDVAGLLMAPDDRANLLAAVDLALDSAAEPSVKPGEAKSPPSSSSVGARRAVLLHSNLVLRGTSQEHEKVARLLDRLKRSAWGDKGRSTGAIPQERRRE